MKKYSAVVKDGNRIVIIRNQEYPTKAEFIRDLRGNGYRVNPKKVKPSDVFDYIMDHTDCNPWDWDLKKVPEESLAAQEDEVEETTEETETSNVVQSPDVNPMCEKCANFIVNCTGTHEKVWTGCVRHEDATDKGKTFAPKKLRPLTDDQLLTAWETTEHLNHPQCSTIRGWLMDEIERRYPREFDAWLDQDAPEDRQLRKYIMAGQ